MYVLTFQYIERESSHIPGEIPGAKQCESSEPATEKLKAADQNH